MDRSVYGQGDTTSEPYGFTSRPFRLTKKETPAPGCKFSFLSCTIPSFPSDVAQVVQPIYNLFYLAAVR